MAGPFDFTGQNIEDSYQRVLQTDGTSVYDGTGSLFTLPGVSKIIDGGGILVSPTTGVGDVTVIATAATYNTATGSYGSFFDTGSYTALSATAIYSMSLSTTDISNGVYISGSTDPNNTYIKFTNAGVYNFQFSAQFANAHNNTAQDVRIWVRKNDSGPANDIPDSAGIITIPGARGGISGKIISTWNYLLTIADGDFVQLCWSTDDTGGNVTLLTEPASISPISPQVPSLIVTAQRVDTFLSNTGSFSGSFTGEFSGTISSVGSFIDGGTF